MIRNIRIEIKIIIGIIFFTLLIVGLERYYLSTIIIDQFNESKKSKNDLLINTITPIVGLNISLGLDSANSAYLDKISEQNKDIKYIEVIDLNGNVIYKQQKDPLEKFEKLHHRSELSSRYITDITTAERLGSIYIDYYDNEYKVMVLKSFQHTVVVSLVAFLLLLVFLVLIKREFRFLNDLSKNVLSFDPAKNDFKIDRVEREDEVGIINNAICTMVEKINSHSKLLDDINASLENKVTKKVAKIIEQKKLIVTQSRLAVMGEMMSMIAHQWRQPLSTTTLMIANAKIKSMLEDKDTSESDKMLDQISDTMIYLSDTIDDFQTYFKPNKSVEKISTSVLIGRMESFIKTRLEHEKVKIHIKECDEEFIEIYINEVIQVLINIINNAIDVLIERKIEGREIWVSFQSDTENITIKIEDNGGGIDSDIIDKIFDPYFSTKSKNGTGLGLYMSKMIIDTYINGSLDVANTSKGACFTLVVPKKGTLNTHKEDIV